MKLKYEMEIIEVGDDRMAVPVDTGDAFRGVLNINGTTADILKLLETDTTEEAIVSGMMAIYDAPEKVIQEDVRRVIAGLREADLICE